MKSTDLTNGERLQVIRRRSRTKQEELAAEHGVSYYRYRRWEKDEGDPPRVPIGPLKLHEACFVKRIRSGRQLPEIAKGIGLSRWWVIQMEQGKQDPARLAAYWKLATKRPVTA